MKKVILVLSCLNAVVNSTNNDALYECPVFDLPPSRVSVGPHPIYTYTFDHQQTSFSDFKLLGFDEVDQESTKRFCNMVCIYAGRQFVNGTFSPNANQGHNIFCKCRD